ncbi:MAG: LysM peptidoglycan-binding domain-containing protein [Anaerolineaceae bacterium]|jgi:nucleoid-associated protein YgaU|nr:LysM peptidoglycan-binding domain-containing protein [Anaerolineaceae bacterium]MDI9531190.1 LysM peptidoglycan-binding domain-containing protein [Chloroflexota bacterium]
MAEKKGLFEKLFGKKEDPKAVKEAARKAEEAKRQAEVAAENAKRVEQAERYKAEAEARRVAAENAKRVEQAERYKAEAEARKAEYEARKAEAAAFIGEHTVTADDTLSHIALKFYGHATPPYYKLIYEANKDVIGDNMNVIVPGQVLRIPALPEELK